MNIDYIIVQAGGNGTRMENLTRNKPKGLVPYENLPILFHLFRQYPRKKFIIIGDYLHEVLEKYLEAFAEVSYITVLAEKKGNCGGLSRALSFVPPKTPFMLLWSDLVLEPHFSLDNMAEADYLGRAKDFQCRWSFLNGELKEEASAENGVAGLFIFRDKGTIADVPPSGEFASYLAKRNIPFMPLSLSGTKEIGSLCQASKKDFRSRPFNRIEVSGDTVTKIPLDEQGRLLARREHEWYRKAAKHSFKAVPEVLSFEPFTMKRIKGSAVFRAELSEEQKRKVLGSFISSLKTLHGFDSAERDVWSILDAYYAKTMRRLDKVRNLIPFAQEAEITINGKARRNIFFYRAAFRRKVEELLFAGPPFVFIHGDCTFSNSFVNDDLSLTFLDPRGYFGHTELYGDPAYDWAKLYYSVWGNYDRFNTGDFTLEIGEHDVTLYIASSGWEHLADELLENVPFYSGEQLRFIHAIIWLSLTAYAWEDYDSICGAFYNGLMLMDEFLESGGQ
ncbi:phosphotransferase [Breznakiellaceae bacterium SP9]